jgi:hypothetical protein
MSETVQPGSTIPFDPSDERVILFDWDDTLAAAAGISTSTFTVTTIKQSGVTALTLDNPTIVAGARSAQVRAKATSATAGDSYWLNHKIVTNESPAQTFERRVKVRIEDR